MGTYLSIVSGAIKLLNYLAAALQQHHDELNGENAVKAADNATSAQVDSDVAKAAVTDTDSDAVDRLRAGGG